MPTLTYDVIGNSIATDTLEVTTGQTYPAETYDALGDSIASDTLEVTTAPTTPPTPAPTKPAFPWWIFLLLLLLLALRKGEEHGGKQRSL